MITFSVEDFASFLNIPFDGPTIWPRCDESSFDWSPINQALSGMRSNVFYPNVNVLFNRARALQHFVRICVIQKAGDRSRLTTPIALATYYLLSGISFDVVHTIIYQISQSSSMRNPSRKKLINLSFGHIIAYLLYKKYGIVSPLEEDIFTYTFAPNTLDKLKKGGEAAEAQEEEEVPVQEQNDQPAETVFQQQGQEQDQQYGYNTDHSMHDAAYQYAGQFLEHDVFPNPASPHLEQPHYASSQQQQPTYGPPPSRGGDQAGYDRFVGVGERVETTLKGMQQEMVYMRRDMNQYGRNQDYLIKIQEDNAKSTQELKAVVDGLASRIHYVLDGANLPRAPRQGETVDIDSD